MTELDCQENRITSLDLAGVRIVAGGSAYYEDLTTKDDVVPERWMQNCPALTRIVLPESVKEVGAWAFSSCSLKGKLVIPDGVSKLGDDAFSYNGKLDTVVLGSHTATLSKGAFYSTGVKHVYARRRVPPSISSYLLSSNPTIHVYTAVLDDYKESGWKEYGSIVGGLEEVYPLDDDPTEAVNGLREQFFEDAACTTLKAEYLAMSDGELTEALTAAGMPAFMADIALKVKNDSWAAYEKDCRIHGYCAYSDAKYWNSKLHIRSASFMGNPTGVYAKQSGDPIYVFVDDDVPEGATLYIAGMAVDKMVNSAKAGQRLRKGLNVVDGADELTVTLHDNKEYSARIIGTDKTTDLALIKIDGKNLPAIRIANSDNVKVGEWVLAIGNPLGLNNTVTAGIISAKARTLGANGVESFIQTDAAINAGNSGGALVNTNGELVGINAMLYSQTGSYSGYGFAIPTTMMNKVVEDLKKFGTVQRAMIGISGRDVKTQVDLEKEEGKEATDYGTMEGIYVGEVVDGSAASEAGIEKGDIITEVDGQKVTKFGDLSGIIAQKRPGDKITLTYLHNKKKQTKIVTLRNEQGNTKVVKNADLDVLGADFREITKAQKEQLEISYGLEVIKVNGGKMKEAGVPKGFIIQRVNDEAMNTIEDLQNAVKDASTSKEPVLIIKGLFPTGKRGYFVVQLQND